MTGFTDHMGVGVQPVHRTVMRSNRRHWSSGKSRRASPATPGPRGTAWHCRGRDLRADACPMPAQAPGTTPTDLAPSASPGTDRCDARTFRYQRPDGQQAQPRRLDRRLGEQPQERRGCRQPSRPEPSHSHPAVTRQTRSPRRHVGGGGASRPRRRTGVRRPAPSSTPA